MRMKFAAWREIYEFCHTIGANYTDVDHLKSIVQRWKKSYMEKKAAAKKSGEGGKKYQETAADELLHHIIYGSSSIDTVEVS